MANVYVRSGAAGAGTGADWANAYTTLAAAFTAKAAGDSFWVSEDHAESTASAVTNTSPGTLANPCFVYCVNHAGTVPPVSADLRTTATITTTGNSNLTNAGSFYCYGITFTSATGAQANQIQLLTAAGRQSYDACAFAFGTSLGSTLIIGANADTRVDWNNTTFNVGANLHIFSVRGALFLWRNTVSAFVGSQSGTAFQVAGTASNALLEGVDLSAITGTIWGALTGARSVYIKDCKLAANVTVCATPTGVGGDLYLVRSDSAAANYRSEKYSYTGTETTETTVTRAGGANDGATNQTRKIVTTANSKWVLPFQALPITMWVDQLVSTTLVLEGTINAAAVPKNDEIWLDVEYLGSSATPQGSLATNTKADNLATGSNLTASTATWNGGGSGAGWSPFQLSVTFTPQQAGWVTLYVKAAKASTTYYVDPRPTGFGVVRSYLAGAPSPISVNERDLGTDCLDNIDVGSDN